MNNHIHEIEINFCNLCTADCIMCSSAHGCGGKDIMSRDDFYILRDQLNDIEYDIAQTSGCGETFLNENYLNFVHQLKTQKPNIPMWIYNNASMLTQERTDYILANNLFQRFHTRVESLDSNIFYKSSKLNQTQVFDNIKYFLSKNKYMQFVILYNNTPRYYNRCKAVLGMRPIKDRFTDKELSQIKNEKSEIQDYFRKYAVNPELVSVSEISHCLWGERAQAPIDTVSPCPKISVIEKVIWVYPNLTIGMCCFEDKQAQYFLGDLHDEHIIDVFNGQRRADMIQKIRNREITGYPCTNPRCCSFGSENSHGMEAK